ncbi:MFS transporter, partial [Chlamydiota bacterium]
MIEAMKLTRRTQIAFLGIRLMGTPCWCLLSMLSFILYKNAHVSPLQIAAIVALKPATSLLSPYWSGTIYGRPDKIIANLVGANLFRYLPFLLFPWIDSVWLIILAFGLYMMLHRATIPAWIELFKHNLPENKREQLVGYGTIVDYLGAALITVLVGILLDKHPESWRWLFSATAALGILSTLLLASLAPSHAPPVDSPAPFKIQEKIAKPWKQVWDLLRHRKDFTIYQIGFMLGGGGLMIMQPALPLFFVDTLNLSFVEMGLAIALCKGVGVA